MYLKMIRKIISLKFHHNSNLIILDSHNRQRNKNHFMWDKCIEIEFQFFYSFENRLTPFYINQIRLLKQQRCILSWKAFLSFCLREFFFVSTAVTNSFKQWCVGDTHCASYCATIQIIYHSSTWPQLFAKKNVKLFACDRCRFYQKGP